PATIVIVAVRDQAETSFKADRSDAATRSGANLHDVPAAVTIVTGKVIESQQLTSVQDVLRNVSGIRLTQTPESVPTFSVRGFGAVSTSGGLEDRSAANTNVFGVERVEVFKGPQAILAGSNSLGGGVNVVVKKPQAELVRDLTLQYGSGADKTVASDLSGALSADKKLSYRLIGTMTRADRNDAGFHGREEDYLLPQLRWKDASTDLIVGFSYGAQFSPVYGSTFANRNGVILPAPPQLIGHRNDGFYSRQKKAFYQLEHALSPGLLLVSRVQRSLNTVTVQTYSASGLRYATAAPSSAPLSSMNFFSARTGDDSAATSGDHYLRTSFNTGGWRHKLSVGVNHSTYSNTQSTWLAPALSGMPYSDIPMALPDLRTSAVTPSYIGSNRQEQKALYVQELISIGNWDLLFNARRTLYDLKPSTGVSINPNPANNIIYRDNGRKSDANTPGAGVVYKVRPDISVYASYAEGFIPQSAQQCSGGIVPPTLTRNKEAGVKVDLLDSQLMLTTSVFSLQQSNRTTYDSLRNCFNLRDSQRTRGAEFDVQGRLAKGWDIIANYSYSKVEDVGDVSAIYAGIPRHKGSVWSTYSFQGADLRGWGLGLGISATSETAGTYNTTYPFTAPGQAQIDASVSWQGRNWNAIFGVKNVADRVLYGSSGASSFVPLLPGRQLMLTVKRSFL
ncbi:MAG: TonB-dependent receptor, partial [Duganella sp.]